MDDLLAGLAPYTVRDEGDAAGGETLTLSTTALFARLLAGRREGIGADRIAYAFHVGLANLIVAACVRLSEECGITACALSGGCFQNLLLCRLVADGLERSGISALTHRLVPPNDGGIALGQAVAASAMVGQGAGATRAPDATGQE